MVILAKACSDALHLRIVAAGALFWALAWYFEPSMALAATLVTIRTVK